MSFPVPQAPAQPFISAAASVAARSGISVRVAPKHGVQVWAVVRTLGNRVVSTESGVWDSAFPCRPHGVYRSVREAVLRHLEACPQEIYCDDENTSAGLLSVGTEAGFRYPPAVAITALDDAVRSAIQDRFATLTISSDSSRGKCSPWLGHGWVLDFGGETGVKLGQKVSEGSSILESELRSIRYGLQAARGTYGAALQGGTDILVRSDSQLALRMLTEPGIAPPSANRFCRDEVARILGYTRDAMVSFRWVQGHRGDPHNGAADRLAVLARRSREADLSFDEVQRLTASAHQDVLNDIRRSSMELAA